MPFFLTFTISVAQAGKNSKLVLKVQAVIVAFTGYSIIVHTIWGQAILQASIGQLPHQPHQAAWNVGATQTQLLVNTCVAVQTATVVATPAADHVINSQSVPFAIQVTGNQVQLVNVQLVGVQSKGVINVGEVCKTGFHVHVGVLFLSNFHVVQSNKAGTEAVALAGHTTSHVQVAAWNVGADVAPLLVGTVHEAHKTIAW